LICWDYPLPGSTINTDEWGAYNHLDKAGRIHVTVCHTPGKRVWAKDEDATASVRFM